MLEYNVEDVEDLYSLSGLFYFAYGIANGTTLATTANMTVCQNAFYYIYYGGKDTYY
jgi:hypothetical protein